MQSQSLMFSKRAMAHFVLVLFSAVGITQAGETALPTSVAAPPDNPATKAKIELGKQLFFDPRLSCTGTVSCNSCHNIMEGGDDGRRTSMGVHGRLGSRSAPTVWNAAFNHSQFWDGRDATLEDQARGPIVAQVEMGMKSHTVAVKRLRQIPGYQQGFRDVFGKNDSVTIANVAKAIAAFERTLITPDSAYDRFIKGDRNALNAQQRRGLKTFRSVGCTECHSGPAFNGWKQGGKPEDQFQLFPRFADARSVGKYDLSADTGRYAVTGKARDRHRFKVPTLRNITLTAPYFHNGSVPTLPESIRVMAETELATDLTKTQIDDIAAFLTSLEGRFPRIVMPRIPSKTGSSVLNSPQPRRRSKVERSPDR